MGTELRDFSDHTLTFSPFISTETWRNRNVLRNIMIQAGFCPYDGEWWHFSYGDKEWAFHNKCKAVYPIKYLFGKKGTIFGDPIFTYIDKANFAVINYTVDGHIFYPGRVIRKVVEMCDKVYTITIGEGLNDNYFGKELSKKMRKKVLKYSTKLMLD